MGKNEVKSFDITSFDIEQEYNQKIAPMYQKIEVLHKDLENKSLQSHRDFLARGNVTQEKIEEIKLALQAKKQKISKTTQEELNQFMVIDKNLKTALAEFTSTESKKNDLLLSEVNLEIEALKKAETLEIEAINDHFNVNVENRVKICTIFKDSYQEDANHQATIIDEYKALLAEKLIEIDEIKKETDLAMEAKLSKFEADKKIENIEIASSFEEIERELNKDTTNIRKDSNLKAKDIKTMIDDMKKVIDNRYNRHLEMLTMHNKNIKDAFLARTKLIDKDLEIHLEKLNKELSSELDSVSNKTQKSITMKVELFELRAKATKEYEKALLDEELLLIQNEVSYIQKVIDDELINLDKLETFLLNDQNEIKDSGDYFKSLNLTMKKELNDFKISHNDYLIKHETLKTKFIKNYNALFFNFKNYLIELNHGNLEKLVQINQEIDDIHHFLDFSDEDRKIQENDLRKSIDVSEVNERYQIQYAKQQHRLALLNYELSTNIAMEEARVNDLLSENQVQIDKVNVKMNSEGKALEILANQQILEALNLERLDVFNLERAILEEKYAKELLITDYEQHILNLQTKRDNSLLIKELKQEIKTLETQIKAQNSILQQQLEKETSIMNQQINQFAFEKESVSATIAANLSLHSIESSKLLHTVNMEFDQKVLLVNLALDANTQVARKNVQEFENIITEKTHQLGYSSLSFEDFLRNTESTLDDAHLSLEELSASVGKETAIISQARSFISRTYKVFDQTVEFISELEKRLYKEQINANSNPSASKKLTKLLKKLTNSQESRLAYIQSAKSENEALIIADLKSAFAAFNTSSFESKSAFIEQAKRLYRDSYDTLQSFQKAIISEINTLYYPIMKADKDIILEAEHLASKEITSINNNRDTELKRINDEFDSYKKLQEEAKAESFEIIDMKMNPIQEKISQLTEKAKEESLSISSEYETLLSTKRSELEEIIQKEEKTMLVLEENLFITKNELDLSYQEALNHLAQKNNDAEKLYSYDVTLNTIEMDTIKSQQEDAINKIDAEHKLHLESSANAVKKLKASVAQFANDADKKLSDLTSVFERNILKLRPKLEKEMFLAQKQLDKVIYEKETKLKSLYKTQEKAMNYLRETLSKQFQSGYDALLQNLSEYLKEYEVIANDFSSKIEASTKAITGENQTVANALFELGKKKHNITQSKLLEINKKII